VCCKVRKIRKVRKMRMKGEGGSSEAWDGKKEE
jgi:hypothetical protein